MAYAAVVGYLESISSAVVWTVAIGLLLSVSAAETRFFTLYLRLMKFG